MRIQIDVVVDTVCTGVLSFKEFACLFGASHGDHFSSLPIEAVVAINGVRKHERQGIASADGQFVFIYAGPESSACMAYISARAIRTWNAVNNIGHTGQRLGTRINEHKLAIRRRDPLSLVFAHAVDCDHRFNWEGTEVVAMASTKQAREFLEAWHSGTNSINRHVDLDAHYEGLRARSTDLRPP
ncbi:unnamed protein product [Schistocephalus solidus]|uniref:HNH endonuclease n=1 Tax=Schistocephalus solidus TaxID=70667 RepID=A0A183TJD8_SCHSO|nr:unnamed protein product [Schistocephalus solidus]